MEKLRRRVVMCTLLLGVSLVVLSYLATSWTNILDYRRQIDSAHTIRYLPVSNPPTMLRFETRRISNIKKITTTRRATGLTTMKSSSNTNKIVQLSFEFHRQKVPDQKSNVSSDLMPIGVSSPNSKKMFVSLVSQKYLSGWNRMTATLQETVRTNTAKGVRLSEQRNPAFICMGNNLGGRGNKLSQMAAYYGLTNHFNMTGAIDFNIFSKFYDNVKFSRTHTPLIVDINKLCSKFIAKSDVTHARFSRSLVDNIDRNLNTKIGGFFHSWMYFYEIMDAVREDLSILDYLQDETQNVLRRVADVIVHKYKFSPATNFTYVGVHVRRGYITSPKYDTYGALSPDIEYYHKGMKYFDERYLNVIFVILTDDVKWTLRKLRYPRSVLMRGNPPTMDMAIMANCNHTVMSVGSYGWWSSFFSGGEVVYHWKQAKPGSKYATQFSKHQVDLFPPYWIPM